MISSKIFIRFCLGIVVIQCFNQVATSEDPKDIGNRCNALVKKSLESIHDEKTEEAVRKLIMYYIELMKKAYEQVYKAIWTEGAVKEAHEEFIEFMKNTTKLLERLKWDVTQIINESKALTGLQKIAGEILHETFHVFNKLGSLIPQEYNEFRSRYISPIQMAIVYCLEEIEYDLFLIRETAVKEKNSS